MTDFTCYLLSPNHSKALPQNVLYLDNETVNTAGKEYQLHTLKLGVTCYVRRRGDIKRQTEAWNVWKSQDDLCNYIDSIVYEKTRLWVFTCNAFFDLQTGGIFKLLPQKGWKLGFIYEEGVTYILKLTKAKRAITFVSTTNYFQRSVKQLGVWLNLPKLDVNFDVVADADLEVYCRRDVEIIKLAMEKYFAFVLDHDLGKFSLTRASQAFAAYRHRFMDKPIIIHKHRKVQELESASYFGGRVECFELGKIKNGPFVTLDFNSMYPYIMTTCDLPNRLLTYIENPIHAGLDKLLKKNAVVAECDINTDLPMYGLRHNNKLIFPTGKLRVNLCTPLLTEAVKRGHLVKIRKLAIYDKTILFDSFVDYFYKLRLTYKSKGDRLMDEYAKFILNSLYGKFGQYKITTDEKECYDLDRYERIKHIDPINHTSWIEYTLFGKTIIEKGKEVANKSLIALSAHVTEYGRLLLWNVIEQIGLDRVLYCDTDGVKIRQSDVERVSCPMHDTDLGCLKIESVTETLEIKGLKNYVTDAGRTMKGVPKQAEQIGPDTFRFMSFPKQKTHMRHGFNDVHIIAPIEKTLSHVYDKGIVARSGRITPFRF